MISPMASLEPLPPPPLGRWQSTWRYVAAGLISLLAWLDVVEDQIPDRPYLLWLDVLAGVIAFIAYRYRRRYPLPVVAGLGLLTTFSGLAGGPAALALISLATRRLWREILPIAALSLVAGGLYYAIYPDTLPWLASLVINILVTGVLIAIGMYIGARRELVATLQDRAERAEAEQALRVAQARTNERARIAREMHDVLAHRISLVALHAGALGYRKDLTSEETAKVAGIIQDNAHQALSDLREILGVLRGDGRPEQPERPQPTLQDLDGLIADERRAGAKIRVHNNAKQLDRMPASVGRNAYRILQESLTNARKHAPYAIVDVTIEGMPGGALSLTVRNPLPVGVNNSTPGAGLGLVGLIERAALAGGSLSHRVALGRFEVSARLPWPA